MGVSPGQHHIIKETKNHNEALLAKEAAEAQARLEELELLEVMQPY